MASDVNTETKKMDSFETGDMVELVMKLDDGRTQAFRGLVMYIKGTGDSRNFCLRKIAADGIGVEKIIPVNSPLIQSITLIKSGSSEVRKSKLFYMRKRKGKSALRV